MKRTILCLLLLIGFQLYPQGQIESQKSSNWQNFTYDMGNVFGGIGHAYSRPFHWEGDDWANFGYLAAGTAVLFLVDDELNHWTNGFSEDVPDFIKDYGNEFGNPNNNYMFTGGVYLAGLFTKNEKLRRTGVLLISAATAGGFLQQVSKRIVGRARPKSGDSSSTYDPLHLDRVFNYDSFPSGHAMLAFSNAYAIAKQFKNPWVKAGIYTVGMIPGFARIMDDFHWVSDVAFSTLLSIFIVESIDRYLDSKYNEKYNAQAKKVSWNLNFGPGTMGVALRF
ncbi:phosphatase PAP2 family protein [Flagellimonas myxillae]|uniref:phosphatase PAP2 family protein n=1 Tax=Flagellimonas myxillae TaxID=2942214 RepID=UPI00201EFA3B|nr:phosphatase PAP2 family protein [Muricauda myxillae]MCL6267005.1 phosphatase PAP2 family protein [Muricauda myxillae]